MILAALIVGLALMCSEVLRYELGRRLEDERHAHAWAEIREAHRLRMELKRRVLRDATLKRTEPML
jgi:hypothetical protein